MRVPQIELPQSGLVAIEGVMGRVSGLGAQATMAENGLGLGVYVDALADPQPFLDVKTARVDGLVHRLAGPEERLIGEDVGLDGAGNDLLGDASSRGEEEGRNGSILGKVADDGAIGGLPEAGDKAWKRVVKAFQFGVAQ